jgi:uncharacterized coiled-coil protein SlyX
VEQAKNKVSETEDKIEELDHIVKDHETMLRKYEWNMQDIWDIMKKQTYDSLEEGKEIQSKGIDNIFNRIIAEKFPNLRKKRVTQVQEAYRTPNKKDQKRNIPDSS